MVPTSRAANRKSSSASASVWTRPHDTRTQWEDILALCWRVGLTVRLRAANGGDQTRSFVVPQSVEMEQMEVARGVDATPHGGCHVTGREGRRVAQPERDARCAAGNRKRARLVDDVLLPPQVVNHPGIRLLLPRAHVRPGVLVEPGADVTTGEAL